jgi:hypothetical protein
MVDSDRVTMLLSKRYFADALYFATLGATQRRSSRAHMLAGIACCGCTGPLARGQRLLEGGATKDRTTQAGPLIVSPMTRLPYEGFFHLIQAFRLEHSLSAPASLSPLADDIADDMAYVSRLEVHSPPEQRKRHAHRTASLGAAMLLRRLTGSDRELPDVTGDPADMNAIIDEELAGTGGDAEFFGAWPDR